MPGPSHVLFKHRPGFTPGALLCVSVCSPSALESPEENPPLGQGWQQGLCNALSESTCSGTTTFREPPTLD